ncbi:MAG: hypothetical protein ACK55A_16290 [Gemmatimonas sp.]
MSTDIRPPHASPVAAGNERRDCHRFEAQLGAWLEHDLEPAEQRWMASHRAGCTACDAMVREIEQVVASAAALPLLSPPRDLWAEIEARLEAPVMPLAPARAPWHSGRWLAVAATLLVAVSSGVTWQLARGRGSSEPVRMVATPAPVADSLGDPGELPQATTTFAVGAMSSVSGVNSARAPIMRTASADADPSAADDERDAADPNVTFEREIVALRRIVDERFTELDPGTVTELRRNLDIIDRAISDSRQALARDPRSGVVSSQLDRALQAKLELLRRVALL